MPAKQVGRYLVDGLNCRDGHIDEALRVQKERKAKSGYQPLGEILVEMGHLSPRALQDALHLQRMEVLAASPVFKSLPAALLLQIAEIAEQRAYPEKALIIEQGEHGDSLCLIISGSVRVFRTTSTGLEITLTTFGPGDGFGEMAVVAGETRSASVQALTPTSLLYISSLQFFEICQSNADLPLAFLRVLCDRLASHNVRLDLVSDEEMAVRKLFGKYITPEIRDEIMSGRVPLDGELKQVTVMFADLRNFTPMVESTPPKEVVKMLNGYFTEMAKAIRLHKGVVLQYLGDEIEAVFGAPVPTADHPLLAVRAALDMRRRLGEYNQTLLKQGRPSLEHGIGIHTGRVVAANIGSPDRLSYALVGDTVNLASRIQGLNKQFGTDILLSATTQASLAGQIALQKLPKVTVKGKAKPVQVYSVI